MTKLLVAGIIYPISDSNWVSPVHVVPKKSRMTVMKNQNDELVPTRLNQATRKDHFPLPFLDQVLEKLAGKSHYCFLDGYSGYKQIHIAPEDQYKTTFTCPFGTFSYTRMSFGLCNPKHVLKMHAEHFLKFIGGLHGGVHGQLHSVCRHFRCMSRKSGSSTEAVHRNRPGVEL
ncbi:hypothetical protein CR513_13986, partial [Mucuna pruriens]